MVRAAGWLGLYIDSEDWEVLSVGMLKDIRARFSGGAMIGVDA